MNMSTAMQGLGYPSELVLEEQAREARQKPVQPQHPDFPWSVSRSLEGLGDEEIELAIQVTHYRPPGDNGYKDHRDPAYDAGEVSFGDAIAVRTGSTIELTPLEWEAVETAFWNQ